MTLPLPLEINCEGLSRKLIHELADHLSMYFESVSVFGDDITACKPVSFKHYDKAWQLLDRYGVKVL